MANEKDWTIMVYMAGDNNLSDDMAFSLSDIQEFTKGLMNIESDKLNLLAFFDSNSLTAPTQYYDFSDPQNPDIHSVRQTDLFHQQTNRQTSRENPAPPTGEGYEGNSASAYSIMNFVRWCISTKGRTAKNYAIIFSGHSFGFHGSSFMRDESSGAYMTIFKFRWALEEIIKLYLNNNNNPKIGILGFDSCVMSMLEVGYELKDVAQTLVASEGSIPNSGWVYSPMFRELVLTFSKPELTPIDVKEAARGFVKGFVEKQKVYAVGGRSVDIAAWDLDLVDPLAVSVSNLAAELQNRLNLPRLMRMNGKITKREVLVFEQLKQAILQSHIACQTYMSEQCIDLKDFCHRLAIECKSLEEQMKLVGFDASSFTTIKKLCGEVIRAVGNCVLKSGYCGDTFQFSNGISMYFPWTALAYSETQFRYQYLRFVKGLGRDGNGIGSGWNDFLFYYLFIATLRKKRGVDNIDFKTQFMELVESDLAHGEWSSQTKENWLGQSRDNWHLGTRDNWRLGTRDNWRLGTRGEAAAFMETFGSFKNYQLDWKLSGFSDADQFDEDDLTCGYFDLAEDE